MYDARLLRWLLRARGLAWWSSIPTLPAWQYYLQDVSWAYIQDVSWSYIVVLW